MTISFSVIWKTQSPGSGDHDEGDDFGRRGILDTFHYLNQAGIKYVGAGKTENEAFAAKYIEVKGLKLAFLAFTDPVLAPGSYLAGAEHPGVAYLDPEKVGAAVRNSNQPA